MADTDKLAEEQSLQVLFAFPYPKEWCVRPKDEQDDTTVMWVQEESPTNLLLGHVLWKVFEQLRHNPAQSFRADHGSADLSS